MSNYQESNNLELKKEYTRSYLKTVCAFANERDGKIIFGIDDSGKVIGLPNSKELRLRTEQAINTTIRPVPLFTLMTETVESKEIVILTVFRGDELPYSYDGKFYKRADTSTVVADGSTIKKWLTKISDITFDEQPTEAKDLTFNILSKALKKKTGATDFNESSLKVLGLKNGESFTNAGKFFSDRSTFLFGCDVVQFGKTRSDFLKRERFTGISLLKQFDKVLAFFDNLYHDYDSVVGSFRIKRIMIPPVAFREALANALVHRDYRFPANIQVEFWNDRVVLTSPGGLPHGMTKEMYLQGNISSLRNPIIAMIFLRLGIIESFGTGVTRMREAYQSFSESPKFEILGTAVRITLPVIDYESSSNELQELREREIINMLEDSGKSRADIQKTLQLGDTYTIKLLNRMIEQKKILRVGTGKNTKYIKVGD